jgi:hypothetical protein
MACSLTTSSPLEATDVSTSGQCPPLGRRQIELVADLSRKSLGSVGDAAGRDSAEGSPSSTGVVVTTGRPGGNGLEHLVLNPCDLKIGAPRGQRSRDKVVRRGPRLWTMTAELDVALRLTALDGFAPPAPAGVGLAATTLGHTSDISRAPRSHWAVVEHTG